MNQQGGMGYDISFAASTASGAHPVAQFGNVYGGGSNKNWWLWALAGAAVAAAVWFFKR
jgi:hypothetical protein